MFTQSAFIRKNTPELREKLEKLGYNIAKRDDNDSREVIRTGYPKDDSIVLYYNYHVPYLNSYAKGIIDCSENEALFLAIAALRDDSDKEQWFTDGDRFLVCKFRETHLTDVGYHKATVQELIEHFK